MNKRTCSMPECDRAHRARGLCATHYNDAHCPDRHAKKPVPCVNCGKVVLKASGGGRVYGYVCSNECRKAITPPPSGKRDPRTCKLPSDHWALWFGRQSTWPRFGWANCTQCDKRFPAKIAEAKFCTLTCSRKWHDANRYERETGLKRGHWESLVRQCAHCGDDYTHASPGAIYCSSRCGREASAQRGGKAKSGSAWLPPTKRAAIYERDNFTCQLCGDPLDMEADPKRSDWGPSVDHILPRSRGGKDNADNLRAAHRWCNAVRGDGDLHNLFEEAIPA